MSETRYKYSSLEDFLASTELTVDGELDDGWRAKFPVKGRELQASILFCDISGFSARSLELTPTETLALASKQFLRLDQRRIATTLSRNHRQVHWR